MHCLVNIPVYDNCFNTSSLTMVLFLWIRLQSFSDNFKCNNFEQAAYFLIFTDPATPSSSRNHNVIVLNKGGGKIKGRNNNSS